LERPHGLQSTVSICKWNLLLDVLGASLALPFSVTTAQVLNLPKVSRHLENINKVSRRHDSLSVAIELRTGDDFNELGNVEINTTTLYSFVIAIQLQTHEIILNIHQQYSEHRQNPRMIHVRNPIAT
jgi:hypothetical protein